jgi:hypothetical protein
MLIETTEKEFKHRFDTDPHPFISEGFLKLNAGKVDRIVRLIEDSQKVNLGLVAGIKDNIFNTSFSSPFGGFHYRNENQYIGTIEEFLGLLCDYFKYNGIEKAHISLPPAIYQESMNAKLVNAMLRTDFRMDLPGITNWIELDKFEGKFMHRSSREYYKQALKNELTFEVLNDLPAKESAYDLIKKNRERFNRPIYMQLDDILDTGKLWPVDFFGVYNTKNELVSSAIFYHFPKNIAYAVFWGDNETGRPLRAMDFLIFNLIENFKSAGFKYIDLGISTESGVPNEGLLRFKETHESISSLRYSFTWEATK